MRIKSSVLAVLVASACATTSLIASASQGYYRFPTLHNDTLVFTAEGDLWKTQLGSNVSQRLTTHPAEERQARISPDGLWLAYVANYEGNDEIYRIPISGGIPERLTFETSRVRLQGWDNAGNLLYSTDNANGPANFWILRQLDTATGISKDLPLADANQGTISDDGKTLFFSRFGLQTTGDNTHQYRGGAMGELWRYELGSDKEAIQLAKGHNGSMSNPLYHQGRIYFLSDASGSGNLWSMDENGQDIQQLTDFEDWQVRSPQLDNNKIVFQLGADIYMMDLAHTKSAPIDIELTSDFAKRQQRWLDKPMDFATHVSFAGNADKVVVTSRGQLAVVSKDKSRLIEIATPANSRSRNAVLSQDGKYVYAFNDASGEMEIWRYPANGNSNAKQMTKDGNTYRWNLVLSPDGRYLAHDDKQGNLFLLDLKSGKNKRIASNASGDSPMTDIVWSPNSELLAYSRTQKGENRPRVVLYNLDKDKQLVLTSDKYESYSPTFSQDGHWLYFLSNRTFVATPSSPWGDRNLGTTFDKRSQIYAYGLTEEAQFPFREATELDGKVEDDESFDLDWSGITNRLWNVPLASGNYYSMKAANKGLYLLDRQAGPNAVPSLKFVKYSQDGVKASTFAKDVSQYDLSNDASRVFWRSQSANKANLFIADAADKAPEDLNAIKLDTSAWQMLLQPQKEWQQMFHDAWIQHRDSLFDPSMRGLDWKATKQKYQPMLARVTDRYELNDIFTQMMGELNALHSQVRGGDFAKQANAAKSALLGARLVNSKNGVTVARIYQHDPELPESAAPLAKPGINAQNGDIIVAINEREVRNLADFTAAMRNQANKQVKVTLKRKGKTFETIVKPVSSAANNKLKYLDWVYNNADKVNQVDEQIGYLHLYAMGANDIASFAREFYANLDKQGLIIDVRRNRGGNIDSWIIEKLMRKSWAFWQNPGDKAYTNMQQAYRGHLVVLADQLTYSDGETFAAGIRALGIAPVMGNRTAGAGVWLSGRNRLTDNGMARAAEYSQFAIDGRWIVEGHGVEPDIRVDNLPLATYQGKDAQLAAAIAYLKEQIAKEPVKQLQGEALPGVNDSAHDIIAK
ncbi:S41 family peptidase [Paraferrimonas haliotis]|uniref:Tricorn protease homolog n=1 Tax=Paraferrimonas haliotis TaxID=2013866 RepID=A0AA37TQ06_9GAMM|nr:S41 family peptidase [Paraferrimonas haliotis]GLS83603.1 tricorn protease [Paraferrimonas haliotis]